MAVPVSHGAAIVVSGAQMIPWREMLVGLAIAIYSFEGICFFIFAQIDYDPLTERPKSTMYAIKHGLFWPYYLICGR